jgi:hypothetical protein
MVRTHVKTSPKQIYFIFQVGLQWAFAQEIYQNSLQILEGAEHRVLYLHTSPPIRKFLTSKIAGSNPTGRTDII